MRILWLFGPPGVGKSVTAWELLNQLTDSGEPASYVDIDQLGMASAETGSEREAGRRQAEALAAVSRVHAMHGATTLIVSGVLNPNQIEAYRRELAGFDLALVRLTVDEVVLKRRMDDRGTYAENWSGVLADARRHEDADHGLPVVHADKDGPSEVARRVLDVAQVIPASSFLPALEPDPTATLDGARAVLITGTRLVGKSTISWHAFTMARQRQIPTAFLDVRQLGFRGRAGGQPDHTLQAAVTAAMWRVFRARGNRLLLLNGTTDAPGQATRYADQLHDTPLITIRLTADRSQLLARAQARSRGEMARLADDDIADANDQYVRQVVDRAYLAQESRSPTPGELVLETTALTAADSAQKVLDLTSI